MLRSLLRLTCCTLLLLASLPGPGQSRPHTARDVLLLEAVKTGILSSLGVDKEPRPIIRASEEELREMYQLYKEKLREMRGNSSQTVRESSQSTVSTVLFPASVELRNVRRRGEPDRTVQWHRAVFHKNPNIQAELTLARAELKISRQVLDRPIKVKVDRRRPVSLLLTNASSSQDVMLDVSPEVQSWLRTEVSHPLVVDIGTSVGEKDPAVSLELSLEPPQPAQRPRLPRSTDKEDDCDEHGWCCMKSVTVSFKDIGWSDWVVAPAEYTMNFCEGACPHNYKPASMHTQVKSRLHQITRGETPRPCCVPAAYEPMVLMHYDSRGKLVLTPFDDLIVSKCHCA